MTQNKEDETRPICPKCNRELIFLALAAAGSVFKTWTCDCEYRDDPEFTPPGLIRNIMECREEDTWCISYDVHKLF